MYRLIGIAAFGGIGIGSAKNIRNFRSDYFTVALIMKMIVTSIQLNSLINEENSYTNLSAETFDLNVISGRSLGKD